MKRFVHFKTNLSNHLFMTTGISRLRERNTRLALKRKMQLAVFVVLFSLIGKAQTYTTATNGNWSNPSTWVGGVVPGSIISAGNVVNVNHTVTYDINSDLKISGALNVVGDTLKFGSSFNNNVQVNSGGLLYVNNGGFIQNIQNHSSDMIVDMGRVLFNNAKVAISKGFLAIKGASRTIRNSTVLIGNKYDLDGTVTSGSIDTIQFSVVEIGISQNGDFRIRANNKLRVADAYIKVDNGSNFRNDPTGSITVLPGANSNYGFDLLKVTGDLQNDGNWVARIDAACISGNIQGAQMAAIDFTRSQDCSATPQIGARPGNLYLLTRF